MTLFRQIAIITTLGFIMLVFSIMWNNVRQSSRFLQGQLQTVAKDMATTMGIAISTAPQGQDMATIETFVNASFDSGYYSNIKVVSNDGRILFEKSREVSLEGVPNWFIDIVSLVPATGMGSFSRGWINSGTVSITLHPGYFYTGLYLNLKNSAFWAVVVALSGLSFLWLLLHIVLKPLSRVRQQAEAIQENSFIIQQEIPKTSELKLVVLAMNKMIAKVKTIFDEQTLMLKKYQDLKFRDEETGLSNRLHFITKIESICKDEGASSGMLAAIRIAGFSRLCEVEGFSGAQAVLFSFKEMVESLLKDYSWTLFGRLNKNEFALYLPGSEEQNRATIENILHTFEQQLDEKQYGYLWLYAGGLAVEKGMKIGELLSNMDMLLAQAESSQRSCFQYQKSAAFDLPSGKKQWRAWLTDAIDKKCFFLVSQQVQQQDGSEFHKELYVRLKNEQGQVVTAGAFMPVAASLGLDVAIDKEMLTLLKEASLKADQKICFAINISERFLMRAEALTELMMFIKACGNTNKQVSFEITHLAFNRNTEVVSSLQELLKEKHFFLGVDHLDLNNSIEPLKSLRPDYVKMNAQQLLNMKEGTVSAGVSALLTLLHGLDIKLIAVGIDSEEMYRQVLDMGVDAVQGHYLGELEELDI